MILQFVKPSLVHLLDLISISKTNSLRKTGIFLCTLFLCSFYSSTVITAQTSIHPQRYIVWFDESNTTPGEIYDFMLDMHSTETWASAHSGVRIWEVDLPYDTPSGPITTINQHKERHDGSQVPGGNGGSGFDYAPPTPILINNNTGGGGSGSGNGGGSNHPPGSFDTDLDCNGEMVTLFKTGNKNHTVSIFDTGNNGYDNVPGYSFLPSNVGGYNYLTGFVDENDFHGHGTHMMSIVSHIATHFNNQNGLSATGTNFRMAKTFTEGGFGYLAEIIQAFETEASQHGMKIANFSFSWRETSDKMDGHPMYKSIEAMRDTFGVLVVASIGNDYEDLNNSYFLNYPACFDLDNIISVGTFDCNDTNADYSNYSNVHLDIFANGNDIPGLNLQGNDLKIASGTSQATAVVSGIATMLSTHQLVFDWEKTKCAIMESAQDAGDLGLKCVSGGYVSAPKAKHKLNRCPIIKNVGIDLPDNQFAGNTKVTPNPTTGIVSMTLNAFDKGEVNIRLVNNLGQIYYNDVRNVFEGQNELNLDLSDLPIGIYHMLVQIGDQKSQEKIIITK